MDAKDDLFDDWHVSYVELGSGLSKVMRAPSRLKMRPEAGNRRVKLTLDESNPGYDERVDWDCDCYETEYAGIRLAFFKGKFSPDHDPHEHEVTIVCMQYPPGGRIRGQMMGYVRHEDPAIPHLTGAWHAAH